MGRRDDVFIIAVRFFLVLYSWKTMGGGGGGDLCDDFFFSSVELKKVTKKAASRSGGRTERRSRENCGRRPFQIRLNASPSPSPLSRSPHQTSLSLPRSARRRRGSKRTSFFISSALPVFTNERDVGIFPPLALVALLPALRPSSGPLFPLRPSLHSSSQLSASLTLDTSADLAGKIAQA